MFRVAIIGCGFIAGNKHLPALAALPDKVELAAFCDIVRSRAERAASAYGDGRALVCEDYRRVLEDRTIDLVHICTPNASHCEITCAALEAGKHVLCEKPMAITGAQGRKMVETARRTGKKLTIGYQCRFRDDVLFLKKAIDDGILGEIYYGKAHAIRRRGVPTWGVFTDKEQQGGGPLIDIGTHALDMTLWFMDNYDVHSVTGVSFEKLGRLPGTCEGNANGPWDCETYDVEDSAMGFIKMKNGAAITLESAWALNTLDVREAKCSLCGTKAGSEMYVDEGGALGCRLNMTMGGRLVSVLPDLSAPPLDPSIGTDAMSLREARHWIESLENGTDCMVSPEQALRVTEILEAIYLSSKTGKEVFLDGSNEKEGAR